MNYNEPIIGEPMDMLLKPDKGFLSYVREAGWLSLEQKVEVIRIEHNFQLGVPIPERCLFNYVNKRYNWYLDELEGWHISNEPFNFPDSSYPH